MTDDHTHRGDDVNSVEAAEREANGGWQPINASTIALAIDTEQNERHGCDQASYDPESEDLSDYQFDGFMNLERVAEILTKAAPTEAKHLTPPAE